MQKGILLTSLVLPLDFSCPNNLKIYDVSTNFLFLTNFPGKTGK